jgi:hypothetical protein
MYTITLLKRGYLKEGRKQSLTVGFESVKGHKKIGLFWLETISAIILDYYNLYLGIRIPFYLFLKVILYQYKTLS